MTDPKTIPVLVADFHDEAEKLVYRMDQGQNMWDFCTKIGLERGPEKALPKVTIDWWSQNDWNQLVHETIKLKETGFLPTAQ